MHREIYGARADCRKYIKKTKEINSVERQTVKIIKDIIVLLMYNSVNRADSDYSK